MCAGGSAEFAHAVQCKDFHHTSDNFLLLKVHKMVVHSSEMLHFCMTAALAFLHVMCKWVCTIGMEARQG